MNEEEARAVCEEDLPEMTQEEKAAAIASWVKKDPWKEVYPEVTPGAQRRLEVAFCFNEYKGKRNLWPIREWRERVERTLTEEDLKCLIRVFPTVESRQHFQDLMMDLRLRAGRTSEAFQRILDGLPEDEVALCRKTMGAVCDLEGALGPSPSDVWKAVGGGIDATTLVADCFLHGHGVDRDVELAAYWLAKAAPHDKWARDRLQELKDEGLA